jgi:radical SAM-linked protein
MTGTSAQPTPRPARPQPEQNQLPVVARLRVRYAKRGPLRFTSHRDFARAFERAVRRAGLPVAFSQGFTPHPKISYASAAPTGTASEAEYLEIGLQAPVDPDWARAALDAALSPGLDILDVREAPRPGLGQADGAASTSLVERLEASRWLIELPGVAPAALAHAIVAFLAADEVMVERMTKQGRRRFDARGAVIALALRPAAPGTTIGALPDTAAGGECAMMEAVVRQVAPAVRPDDVLAGLRVVADLVPPVPPRATRLAQGSLTPHGEIADPLDAVTLSICAASDPDGDRRVGSA